MKMAKRFIDDAKTLVNDAIDGLLQSSGGSLSRLDGYDRAIRVVLRTDYDSAVKTAGRVALISGGGSGPPASELANRVYVRTRRLSFVDAQGTSRRMPALSARGCLLLQCAGTSSPRHQSVLRACRSTSAHRICALAWP